MNYQYRYAAYIATRLLSNESPPEAWDLKPEVRLKTILMEQDAAIDDTLCTTSQDAYVFVQAKRSLSVSSLPHSQYGKFIKSTVDLIVNFREHLRRDGHAPRDFDYSTDRIVLALGRGKPVIDHLGGACSLARSALPWTKPVRTRPGQNVLATTLTLLRTHWASLTGNAPSDENLRSVLRAVYVDPCDCVNHGTDEGIALDRLRRIVLPPAKAHDVWLRLIALFEDASIRGDGFDKHLLITEMRKLGAQLVSERADHSRDRSTLLQRSIAFAEQYSDRIFLAVRGDQVTLRQATQNELRANAAAGSLLLIGDPGIGKTGACVSLFNACRQETKNVVFLPVEQLLGGELLHKQLGLSNDLPSIFLEWGVDQTAYVIVDGLDAIRGHDERNAILSTLGEMRKLSSQNWRFIASVRRFDAERALRRDSTPLARIFLRDNPEAGPTVATLDQLLTQAIPELSDQDLAEVEQKLPELRSALTNVNLRKLARIPFNLQILVEILQTGATGTDVAGLRTQAELLRKYWERRVGRDNNTAQREHLLRVALKSMMERIEMGFEDKHISESSHATILPDLCSIGLLTESQPSSAFSPKVYRFSHSVLFDFALAKLVLYDADELASALGGNPGLVTMITPSLRMLFADLWDDPSSREEFWRIVFRIASDPQVPNVADLVAVAISTQGATRREDLAPLLERLNNPSMRATALKVIAWMNGSLQVGDVDPFAMGGEPWGRLALALAENPDDGADFQSLRLQGVLLEKPERLATDAGTDLAKAARALTAHWLEQQNDRLRATAIGHVLKTFRFEPSEAADTLRRILDSASFSEIAWNDAPAIARHLSLIHDQDPGLVADIYVTVFRTQTESREPVSMTGSRIFGFVSNRRQDLDHAKWQLGQDFVQFFRNAPREATVALSRALEAHKRTQKTMANDGPQMSVIYKGRTITVHQDLSSIWLGSAVTSHDPIFEMLDNWFAEMLKLRSSDLAAYQEALRLYVSGASSTVFWRKLLLVASDNPDTLGVDVADALLNQSLLFNPDTTRPAGQYIARVFPYLSNQQRMAIEEAIVK